MEQKAAVSLLQAMTLLQSVVLSCIDRKYFPFTKTQLVIFIALDTEGEMTMKRVSQCIASSREQATRAVAPLADAGYVERRTDASNRTRVYVRLTQAGHQLLEQTLSVLTERLSERLNRSLGEDEKAVLNQAIRDIIRLIEKTGPDLTAGTEKQQPLPTP